MHTITDSVHTVTVHVFMNSAGLRWIRYQSPCRLTKCVASWYFLKTVCPCVLSLLCFVSLPVTIHIWMQYDALPALDVARRQASPVDFFQTLSAAFRGFNDAHTRFFSPLQAFHYVRPMVLTTRLVTPQPGATPEQQVFFSKVNPLYSLLNATQVLAVTVSWKDFVGRRVYRINGVDALTYLKVTLELIRRIIETKFAFAFALQGKSNSMMEFAL